MQIFNTLGLSLRRIAIVFKKTSIAIGRNISIKYFPRVEIEVQKSNMCPLNNPIHYVKVITYTNYFTNRILIFRKANWILFHH